MILREKIKIELKNRNYKIKSIISASTELTKFRNTS